MLGGHRAKVHLFVMTLGYSRRMYATATTNERLPVFLRCHEEAFEHFGGVPHEILYDNSRTVVLSRDFEGRHVQWNQTFWDFCRYYGFRPWAHRPYRAQTKGKVESGIKYVKRFLRGKSFESVGHLNTSLIHWIDTVADQRSHGTTHRRPIDMFAEERGLLLAHTGRPPYVVQERPVRQVAKDCLVTFQTNRYSVPFLYAGKEVNVQSLRDHILIYHDDALIARHRRCEGTFQSQITQEHYAGLRHRQQQCLVSVLTAQPLCPMEDVEVRDLAFYESLLQGGVL